MAKPHRPTQSQPSPTSGHAVSRSWWSQESPLNSICYGDRQGLPTPGAAWEPRSSEAWSLTGSVPEGSEGLGLHEAGPLHSRVLPGSWNALPRPSRVHSFNQSEEENLAKPRLHLKIRQNLLSTTSRRRNLVRTVLIIIFSLNSYCRIY